MRERILSDLKRLAVPDAEPQTSRDIEVNLSASAYRAVSFLAGLCGLSGKRTVEFLIDYALDDIEKRFLDRLEGEGTGQANAGNPA